jgi:hypothetical protein
MYFWDVPTEAPVIYSPIPVTRLFSNPAPPQGPVMKSIEEVLRVKEEEIQRVRKEVEALRIAAGLLNDTEAASAERQTEYRQLLQMP